eukprot:XP_001693423.1 predicted protein [Chlamydomonas reinhardtii]
MALFADSDTVCEVCGCGAQASEWLINCKNSAWQVSERGTFDCVLALRVCPDPAVVPRPKKQAAKARKGAAAKADHPPSAFAHQDAQQAMEEGRPEAAGGRKRVKVQLMLPRAGSGEAPAAGRHQVEEDELGKWPGSLPTSVVGDRAQFNGMQLGVALSARALPEPMRRLVEMGNREMQQQCERLKAAGRGAAEPPLVSWELTPLEAVPADIKDVLEHYQEHEADATCALLILKYALGDAGEDFQRLYMALEAALPTHLLALDIRFLAQHPERLRDLPRNEVKGLLCLTGSREHIHRSATWVVSWDRAQSIARWHKDAQPFGARRSSSAGLPPAGTHALVNPLYRAPYSVSSCTRSLCLGRVCRASGAPEGARNLGTVVSARVDGRSWGCRECDAGSRAGQGVSPAGGSGVVLKRVARDGAAGQCLRGGRGTGAVDTGFLSTPPTVLEQLLGCLAAGSDNGTASTGAGASAAADAGGLSGWAASSGPWAVYMRASDLAAVLFDAVRLMHVSRPARLVVAAYGAAAAPQLTSKGRRAKDVLCGAVQEVVALLDLLLQPVWQARWQALAAAEDIARASGLYEGHYAEQAIRRYWDLWMPLLLQHQRTRDPAQAALLVAPLDVQWAWFVHRLNPNKYLDDCRARFGRELHPASPQQALGFSGCGLGSGGVQALSESEEYTRRAWAAAYPAGPVAFAHGPQRRLRRRLPRAAAQWHCMTADLLHLCDPAHPHSPVTSNDHTFWRALFPLPAEGEGKAEPRTPPGAGAASKASSASASTRVYAELMRRRKAAQPDRATALAWGLPVVVGLIVAAVCVTFYVSTRGVYCRCAPDMWSTDTAAGTGAAGAAPAGLGSGAISATAVCGCVLAVSAGLLIAGLVRSIVLSVRGYGGSQRGSPPLVCTLAMRFAAAAGLAVSTLPNSARRPMCPLDHGMMLTCLNPKVLWLPHDLDFDTLAAALGAALADFPVLAGSLWTWTKRCGVGSRCSRWRRSRWEVEARGRRLRGRNCVTGRQKTLGAWLEVQPGAAASGGRKGGVASSSAAAAVGGYIGVAVDLRRNGQAPPSLTRAGCAVTSSSSRPSCSPGVSGPNEPLLPPNFFGNGVWCLHQDAMVTCWSAIDYWSLDFGPGAGAAVVNDGMTSTEDDGGSPSGPRHNQPVQYSGSQVQSSVQFMKKGAFISGSGVQVLCNLPEAPTAEKKDLTVARHNLLSLPQGPLLLRISGDGKALCVVQAPVPGQLQIFDLQALLAQNPQALKDARTLRDHDRPIVALASSSCTNHVASSNAGGTVYLHDAALAQRATLGALSNGTSSVVTPKRCLAFSQTSSPLRLAAGSDDGHVLLWQVLPAVSGPIVLNSKMRARVMGVGFGTYNKVSASVLISCAETGQLMLTDLSTYPKLENTISMELAVSVSCMAVRDDGAVLAIGTKDGRVGVLGVQEAVQHKAKAVNLIRVFDLGTHLEVTDVAFHFSRSGLKDSRDGAAIPSGHRRSSDSGGLSGLTAPSTAATTVAVGATQEVPAPAAPVVVVPSSAVGEPHAGTSSASRAPPVVSSPVGSPSRAVISPRGAGSAPFSGLPGRGAAGPGGGGGGGAELLSSNLRSYMDEMKDMMRELVFGLQADMVRQSLASEAALQRATEELRAENQVLRAEVGRLSQQLDTALRFGLLGQQRGPW